MFRIASWRDGVLTALGGVTPGAMDGHIGERGFAARTPAAMGRNRVRRGVNGHAHDAALITQPKALRTSCKAGSKRVGLAFAKPVPSDAANPNSGTVSK